MFGLLRPLAFGVVILVVGLVAYQYGYRTPPAPEPPAVSQTTPDREATRQIVREYLIEHPEVLEEAMKALRAKRQAAERVRAQAAIAENRADLLSHSMSPASGNPDGDVTMVEFFDYACGYCKRSLDVVLGLLSSDPQLRIVWKELPVLGPMSRFAARAAVAAERQGRYFEFHKAVMGTRGGLSEDAVMTISGRIGLDVERLRQDMDDPAIEAYLDETHQLARELGIEGTPAFVIGDTLVPGAVGEARLKELIAEARSGG